MSYEEREFPAISMTPLQRLDEIAVQALETAVPNDRYAIRDVEFNDTGQLHVIDRDEPTLITPDILYREVRDRRPLQIIDAVDPPRTGRMREAHVKVARWFNHDLYEEYRSQIYEPMPRFRGLLNACIATNELQFLIPRPATPDERDAYDREYHEYLAGFSLYGFYVDDDSNYRALDFVTPDFRKLFFTRRTELCEAVAEFSRDAQQYARDQKIDLFNPDEDAQLHLCELREITTLAAVHQQSLAEATHMYLAKESVQCSLEMKQEFYPRLNEDHDWERTQKLLTSFVSRIVTQP